MSQGDRFCVFCHTVVCRGVMRCWDLVPSGLVLLFWLAAALAAYKKLMLI